MQREVVAGPGWAHGPWANVGGHRFACGRSGEQLNPPPTPPGCHVCPQNTARKWQRQVPTPAPLESPLPAAELQHPRASGPGDWVDAGPRGDEGEDGRSRRERKILDVVSDAWPLELPVAMLSRSRT